MLTALPASLRQIAATNIPAVSSILWHEFLDNNKPDWFTALPSNIQSYLIVEYGPSTAWPTSKPTSSASSASSTASSSGPSSVVASATASSTSNPDSPPASDSGLSQGAKIGIGIGVPLGVLALAAVLIPLCFACRRKNKKKTSGYEPPPSPGFMPHGAFQEKSTSYQEYRSPLHQPTLNRSQSWDHDDEMWLPEESQHRAHNVAPAAHNTLNAPMGNSTTVIGPALVHTHSSNRARGKRTSYSSLHSVAEVHEPDDSYAAYTPRERMLRRSSKSLHQQDPPPVPTTPSIRRKPISSVDTPSSPVERTSGHFSLLRPAILHQDHSGSSSSGHLPALSPDDSRRSSDITDATSPGPSTPPNYHPQHVNQNHPANPFSNDYAYVEDYGPEYGHGYVDVDDGLYGGHRRLEAYPALPEKSEKRGKTDWPLKDWPLKSLGSRRARERSPQWDRVYER